MFYDSKTYFLLPLELFFYTFVVIDTESRKLKIYILEEESRKLEIKMLVDRANQNGEFRDRVLKFKK